MHVYLCSGWATSQIWDWLPRRATTSGQEKLFALQRGRVTVCDRAAKRSVPATDQTLKSLQGSHFLIKFEQIVHRWPPKLAALRRNRDPWVTGDVNHHGWESLCPLNDWSWKGVAFEVCLLAFVYELQFTRCAGMYRSSACAHEFIQLYELFQIIEEYRQHTDGSWIEDKESALVWHYENADPEYGR